MSTDEKSGDACTGASCQSTGDRQREMDEQEHQLVESLDNIQHKLLVMSGKGGVGKSSLSANIAVALAGKGFQVGLMDVDLHGPSIAGIMGLNGLFDIGENRKILPKHFSETLKVVSMQSLMQEPDQAIIWRGPAKNSVIRQFISGVQWGRLDFLVIDSPPGTGDEPLSVAQTIPGAKAIIVTTPQDVALADVRKSINFCRVVGLEMAGLIENMGPFNCPCCGQRIAPFGKSGGEATARTMGIPFLGTLPFDPKIVETCDRGKPLLAETTASAFSATLHDIIVKLVERL